MVSEYHRQYLGKIKQVADHDAIQRIRVQWVPVTELVVHAHGLEELIRPRLVLGRKSGVDGAGLDLVFEELAVEVREILVN
jgi:hypothetical protein